jgi:hypothetical protein
VVDGESVPASVLGDSPQEEEEQGRGERQQQQPDELMRVFTCGQCSLEFNTMAALYTHRRGCRPDGLPNAQQLCEGFECGTCSLAPSMTTMDGVYRSITITPSELCITGEQFFNCTREGVLKILNHCLENGEDVKVFSTTEVKMYKVNISDGMADQEKNLLFFKKAAIIQIVTKAHNLVDDFQLKVD